MNRMIAAGVSGLIATAPMTLAMLTVRRLLLAKEQAKPLPPHAITMNVAEKLHVKQQMESDAGRYAASMTSHFAVGAVSAPLYPLLFEKLPATPLVRGAALGMTVWAGYYLGLMPATGLFPSALHQSRGRNLILTLSHLVWGMTTVALYRELTRPHPSAPAPQQYTALQAA